ncbi:tyrosine-type recombinase/integrase [Laribacter hongkongensis]|uniref:tyrosine-type recombinase/integrase n=1 Tax=Laribacter hongkongensis TaxID=168471 RepID=UPI001EFC6F22|nr:integrase arm-type DNA-binding domain-containing protein [Laribacter hongkongensis]MCG9054756.1 tyrosine-type recombinase/integrase [Laribacter hongkongensis]MCG9064684.1 tyrosine-type recombinase/integrase [Laribacter hongkongensis]
MPLTDIKIRQTKATDKIIKLTDGNGLYIEIKPNGSKLWRYRYKIAGKENLFAIGEYPTLSLQEARKARDDARELVKQGVHPSHARQAVLSSQLTQNTNTFEFVAREWLERKKAKWTPYSYKQAVSCLEQNAFPKIGRLPIRGVTAAHLLEILQAMEKRGAETYAIMLRQWCSAIFRHAVMTLRADSDPAAALKGVVQRPQINHSKPMSVEQIGDFKARLTGYGGNRTTVIAMRMMLYTFVRTVELRKATWSEIDLNAAEWRIPAERMKKRRVHLVPLSRQAVSLLEELKQITGSGTWLFPNFRRPADVMSATTINRALEYMGYPSSLWTGHDFRATASTQLYEMGYRQDVIELQLAHVEGNKTKAAYNHAEHMTRRCEMMQAWSDWIDGIPERETGSPLKVLGTDPGD